MSESVAPVCKLVRILSINDLLVGSSRGNVYLQFMILRRIWKNFDHQGEAYNNFIEWTKTNFLISFGQVIKSFHIRAIILDVHMLASSLMNKARVSQFQVAKLIMNFVPARRSVAHDWPMRCCLSRNSDLSPTCREQTKERDRIG
jgi:hypothetical protein